MPGETFTFEEATTPPPAGGVPSPSTMRIPPEVQAQRDVERRKIVQSEYQDPKYDPTTHEALGRELKRIPPGPAAKPETFSFEEALGKPAGDPLKALKHKSDLEITLGGVGAASMAIATDAASLADMAISMPHQLVGTVAEGWRRVQGLFAGEDRAATAKAGREAYRRWADSAPQPVTKFVQLFTPAGEQPSDSNVQQAMNYVIALTDRDAESIQERTGGLIRKEDYQMARDGLMGILGIKATVHPVGRLAERTFATKPEDIKDMVSERDFTPPPEPARPKDPVSRAKQDIEQTTGIKDVAARAKAQKQRRADARAAFQDDPAYATYLQNYAEEEARQADAAAARGQADAAAEAADKAAPSRVGGAEAVLLDESGKPIPPRALDTALDKAVKGQSFLMTAEEKLALSKASSKWVQRDVEQPFNREAGAADPDLLKILAVGGVGAALAYAYPDQSKEGLQAMAGGVFLLGDTGKIAAHAEKAPLSTILKDSSTTLKTLERLPQNKFLFSLDSIEQQLRRDDVPKAEKDILGEVVKQQREQGNKDVTAKDLVLGAKVAMHDFELTEKTTDTFATYGLDGIDRLSADDHQWNIAGIQQATIEKNPHTGLYDVLDPDGELLDSIPVLEGATPQDALREWQGRAVTALQGPQAKTSIWRLPMEVSDANHFSDPNYFGHTRSFEEGGVKHVVELQSDLAQKAGKPASAERVQELETIVDSLTKQVNAFGDAFVGLSAHIPEAFPADVKKLMGRLRKITPDIGTDIGERAREFALDYLRRVKSDSDLLQEAKHEVTTRSADSVIDYLANHGALYLREALHRSLREQSARYEVLRAEMETNLRNLREATRTEAISPMFRDWYKRLVREELAASFRQRAELQALRNTYNRILQDNKNHVERSPEVDAYIDAEEKAIAQYDDRIAAMGKVRFGTADTVAKVEGWPKRLVFKEGAEVPSPYDRTERLIVRDGALQVVGPAGEMYSRLGIQQAENLLQQHPNLREALVEREAFRPEHQGIYDRYKRDVEKFLRQLGGKEHTDSAGHTWIEVPVEPGAARAQMFGRAEPELLARLAAVGAGLALGTTLDKDNPIEGGILGVVAGAFLATGRVREIGSKIKELGKPDPRIRVDDIGNKHEYMIKLGEITNKQLRDHIEELVPDEARRVAVTQAIERGSPVGLKGRELKAYTIARNFFEGIKDQAFDAGVLDSARENYATHIWDYGLQKRPGAAGPSMSPENRFAKRRFYPTIAEGKAAGLVPKTEDIGQIMEIYGNSMVRSMANKQLIEALKAARAEDGVGLVLPMKKAPSTYVSINHPQFAGLRVHPDIKPSLQFMFDQKNGSAAIRAAEGVNTALKRMAVSFSLFHAKALFDAAIGAAQNPLTAAKVLGQAAFPKVFGTNKYLLELRNRGVSPTIDAALRGGLTFSLERGSAAVEDVGGSFYRGMRDLQGMLDQAVPHLGAPVAGLIRLNHAFDNFMWGRLHAGMKLTIFAEKYEALRRNNPNLTDQRAAEIAASFTNDMFGGLNWRRVAEEANTKFGRDVKLALLNPTARRGLQVLMFAPDWTYSTTRAFTQAFRKGSGVKGIFKAQELGDLHRQYLLRSAIYYTAIGSAINYAFTGKPIWENKDPTRIDLGDGRTMQWSKHTMEPIHWITQPGQQALNKLGYIPREGLSQAFGVEYLSTSGHAPKMDTSPEGRVKHVLKSASPIGVQQFRDAGTAQGISGLLGAPIYGQTREERALQMRKMRIERMRKKLEQEASR